MYYFNPFRLAKTSIAKQSTYHCVVFDTQADFVGAIEHIAPMAITNSPEISVKSGLFAGAMCSIAPYGHIGKIAAKAGRKFPVAFFCTFGYNTTIITNRRPQSWL